MFSANRARKWTPKCQIYKGCRFCIEYRYWKLGTDMQYKWWEISIRILRNWNPSTGTKVADFVLSTGSNRKFENSTFRFCGIGNWVPELNIAYWYASLSTDMQCYEMPVLTGCGEWIWWVGGGGLFALLQPFIKERPLALFSLLDTKGPFPLLFSLTHSLSLLELHQHQELGGLNLEEGFGGADLPSWARSGKLVAKVRFLGI